MDKILLRRLPIRRVELLFCISVVLVGCALTGLLREDQYIASLFTLLAAELILPVSMGLVSAGLLAGDPALEILLSMHRPVWRVLAERAGILFGLSCGLGALLLILAQQWHITLPRDGTDRIFIWLSPLVFYIGMANAVALLRGRFLDGVIAVLGMMGLSVMATFQIPSLCESLQAGAQCEVWLATPLMTLGNAIDLYWPLNRLLWFVAGIGLMALSFTLARREEPLLPQAANE